MDSGDIWKVVLLLVCLGFSAFFSASETAFVALQKIRILHLTRTRKAGAERVSKLTDKSDRLLATVLLGNNLANTAVASIATALAISMLDNEELALALAASGVAIFLLVFCETIPKILSLNRAEDIAFAFSRPLIFLGWILSPVIYILERISTLARLVLGVKEAQGQIGEGEIRTMISLGAEAGTVQPQEAEMLEKVFHFGDSQIRDVMTPRTEIVWVPQKTTIADFLEIYALETHTRFPVFGKDIEDVLGILSIKDLLKMGVGHGISMSDDSTKTLRPAYFVPETKMVGELFSELREAGQQMAMVVDHLGSVAGLITLKRLLEVIVGPVGEEGKPAEESVVKVGENLYEVDGGLGIHEANEELGLQLPDGDYQTVAGFILQEMGHIPNIGETLVCSGGLLEVVEMNRLKIERVRIQLEQ